MEMMMDYSLPEFVHLDGIDHNGDSLKGRTVIQHIRSYTILEVVSLDELQFYSFKGKTHEFIYVDIYGVEEHFMFVLHFSLAGDDDSVLNPIFRKCEKWYKNVLAWEDENTEL